MDENITITVIMNNNTKNKLEADPKLNKKARDKLYAFAIKTIKQKGYASFIFDDELSDNELIFIYEDIEEVIKIK